jgi:hypothetical protein
MLGPSEVRNTRIGSHSNRIRHLPQIAEMKSKRSHGKSLSNFFVSASYS